MGLFQVVSTKSLNNRAPGHGLLPPLQNWAYPISRGAAGIYAARCLIDETPELLFPLRGTEPAALLANHGTAVELDAARLADISDIYISLN